MAGYVELYLDGEAIERNYYQSPAKRRRFVKYWTKKYGREINDMGLLIIPDDPKIKYPVTKVALPSFILRQRKILREKKALKTKQQI